ncbi:VWA domain-containing protein [Chryseobacterium sp. MA9]|uniref:vWA domain-containing protein n=1 Tax=Chryseobacterium sp. MA9 TaxID=2966625 RepID=UPI00210233D5|nr:VWA domain-containing protein [Chryseobacterium sp. MA9]UTX50178.1 VWA domain-containing protein [Chryseobacterium sp. MA9]
MRKIVITMLGLAALTSCKTQKNTEKTNETKTYSIRKDKDQDGIPNKLDKCPDIAGPVENEGCPWVESDGDGVIDKDDACPTVAGPPENNGCPWPDTDGDGILDKDDACPTVPGMPEYNGCPKAKTLVAMEVSSTRSAVFHESGRVYDHQVGNRKNVKKTIKKTDKNIDYDNEEYTALVENAFELTRNQPVSTFSIDVDNTSYSNVRRMINYGTTVDKNSVRVEEMINYFKYDYPQPANDDPFSINTEYSESPWNPKHKLLKIGLQGKNIPMDRLPASNIVFLIDVSGSMNEENKLPLLKSSLKVLLNQLRPKDRVGIVVYAGNAGMVLPPTSAGEKEKIIQALDKLQAGGSTAGGAGIELAYKLAKENFIKGGNNRIVLATDGDFNVGASSTTDIEALITEKRKTGIFLTCLGYGMGNYKDNKMEILADKGNGNYAYIDNMQEANKFLGREFAGSMYTIAKDVKIQIEFNPKYVKSYRLIGYENRKLRNEDFVNDKIDAGELGSGHTVTALYEIIPANVESEFIPKETKLKYSATSDTKKFGDEMATVKFRYKKPDGDTSREISKIVKNGDSRISSTSSDFKFASSVAWFGLVLRNSELITKKDLTDIENLAKQDKSKDEEGYRSEFIRLIESYKTIQK